MNNNKTDNKEKNRLGIFTAGFRWSGSSAVSDWLESFSSIRKPEGCEASYDEIRALNYGFNYFLKIILKNIYIGEKLARYSLCPDKSRWGAFFGSYFYKEKGLFSPAAAVADFLFMVAAKSRLNPGLDKYGELLNTQLGTDYLNDSEYLETVKRFTESVRNAVRKKPSDWSEIASDRELSDSSSALFALFYDRYYIRGYIPVMDNAISGLNPHFFDLINSAHFSRKIIIFVVRDPRDQFAELVKFSAKTFSFMVKNFIYDYEKKQKKISEYISSMKNDTSSDVNLISFEDFVCNSSGIRDNLKKTLADSMNEYEINYSFDNKVYSAENSLKNIGVWKKSGLNREMELISKKLKPFLKEQAD